LCFINDPEKSVGKYEGSVSLNQDKVIAKRAVKITGAIPANN
jgi:hypothetical protein